MLSSFLLLQATTAAPGPYTAPPPPPAYVYPAPPPGYAYPSPPPPPGYAPPDAPIAPAPDPHAQPQREWIMRLQVGLGSVAHSEEDEALDKEGYGGTVRFLAMLDGTWMLGEYLGIGAWGSYGTRSETATDRSPKLHETTWMLGIQAPIVFGSTSDSFRVMLTPRLARAWSTLSLGNGGTAVPAWAYGGDIGIYAPRLHFGGALGYLAAPSLSPGDLGRAYDLGGLYLLIGGMIDG